MTRKFKIFLPVFVSWWKTKFLRQHTTLIDSGTNFHCIHVFVVIHRFQKSPTSKKLKLHQKLKVFVNRWKTKKIFKFSRQYTTFIDSGTNFHCVHIFVVIHKISKIANFKRIYLENYNDSEHAVKAKNAPFFMIFPNISFFSYDCKFLLLWISNLFWSIRNGIYQFGDSANYLIDCLFSSSSI